MWTRAELKENAKQVLRRTYWNVFVVMLIVGVLSSGQSGISIVSELQNFGLSFPVRVVGTVGTVSFLLAVFLVNPLMVGKNYYLLRAREHDPEISHIFSRFGGGYYGNVITTMLVKDIKIFLWSLLLVVPGIIKSYEYFFVPYILAENPSIPGKRAFEMSKAMTDGVKLQIFILELSFVGWYFLGALALGIGTFFVNPYFEATMAELYMAQRAKLLMDYSADEREFCGFDN